MSENEVLYVRSSKKNGNKSTEGDSSTNEDDIWDDTLLIKAYDKAVQLTQENYIRKKQNPDNEAVKSKVKKKGEVQKWEIGDKCKCQYSEDLKFYEADIIEILGSTGMCIVRYVGYENEEKVSLKKLKQSEGEAARTRQCKEALEENTYQNGMEYQNDAVTNSDTKPQSVQKKPFSAKKEHLKKKNGFSENNSFSSLNFPLPQIGHSIIPPPPPPQMFNRLSEDENENDAMSAMLISWYMSGYHTGYYQGLKMAKKQ